MNVFIVVSIFQRQTVRTICNDSITCNDVYATLLDVCVHIRCLTWSNKKRLTSMEKYQLKNDHKMTPHIGIVVNPFKTKKAKRAGYLMKFCTLSFHAHHSLSFALSFCFSLSIYFYFHLIFLILCADNPCQSYWNKSVSHLLACDWTIAREDERAKRRGKTVQQGPEQSWAEHSLCSTWRVLSFVTWI